MRKEEARDRIQHLAAELSNHETIDKAWHTYHYRQSQNRQQLLKDFVELKKKFNELHRLIKETSA